jgi:hypothetical protein
VQNEIERFEDDMRDSIAVGRFELAQIFPEEVLDALFS